jgi:VWFA-related protein
VALLLAGFFAVAAVQAPPQFRGGVTLVHLDVSVLDKNRRPIRGLTEGDFTLLEDGKPQKIVAFSAVDIPDAPQPSAQWMRDISPDVQSNADVNNPEGRLFVILLDDALIPFEAGAIPNAKRIARRVVDQISPADRVAVVFSAGSGGAQNFTSDRTRLLKAIDTLNPSYAMHTAGWDTAPPAEVQKMPPPRPPPVPMDDPDIPYRLASARTLRMVAETLISAPERRKVLLFVSPGISLDSSNASVPVLIRGIRDQPMARKRANDELAGQMPDLFRRMQTANVTIYPVDPCGLDGFEAYTLRVARGLPSLKNPDTLPADYNWLVPSGPPPADELGHHIATLSMEFLMTAALNTGGRAIVNRNDFEAGIDEVFRENGSYYLLGYAAPAVNKPGSLHRLNVRVNRQDVTVRTRSGYAMTEAVKPEAKGKAAPPAARTVAGPVAIGDLPMRIALAPIATPKGATVAIVLGMSQPGVEVETEQKFDLETRAFTPDGQPRGSQRQQGQIVVLPSKSSPTADHEFLSQFALAPGRYELRVGVRRQADGAEGSVYADVDVPDFARAPLSVSGVFVEATPSVPGGPRNLFASLAPIVPTAAREFHPGHRVTGFMRIYQGGDAAIVPASVSVRLVDRADAPVLQTTDALGVEKFDATTRAADYRFQIPVAQLASGPYLLSFEIKAGGASVARHVRFSVR